MSLGQTRTRVLRDAELARLVAELQEAGAARMAGELVDWAEARDAERRGLADETLERYRELNLLYDLAERSASLDPAEIAEVAAAKVVRICRRGAGVVLVTNEADGRLEPVSGVAGIPSEFAVEGLPLGVGIVGGLALAGEGEIVNDPASDVRASSLEAKLGSLMAAPMTVGERRIGVLLVIAPPESEFSAGEHRLLMAVAALTASALNLALIHQRSIAFARTREAELQRELDELRSEVAASRHEQSVREITGSEYFQNLRSQAAGMRRTLKTKRHSKEK